MSTAREQTGSNPDYNLDGDLEAFARVLQSTPLEQRAKVLLEWIQNLRPEFFGSQSEAALRLPPEVAANNEQPLDEDAARSMKSDKKDLGNFKVDGRDYRLERYYSLRKPKTVENHYLQYEAIPLNHQNITENFINFEWTWTGSGGIPINTHRIISENYRRSGLGAQVLLLGERALKNSGYKEVCARSAILASIAWFIRQGYFLLDQNDYNPELLLALKNHLTDFSFKINSPDRPIFLGKFLAEQPKHSEH